MVLRELHPNLKLLSHNSQLTLHGCPRKFYLYRMLKKQLAEGIERGDIHTDFGGIVGYGCQQLLTGSPRQKTMVEMLSKWRLELEEDTEKRQKKTFFHALHAVEKFENFLLERLGNYELVQLGEEGGEEPAIELGFEIDCGGGFSYRGLLDALLVNKNNGNFAVWEGKTTSGRADEAMYRNSNQGLSYSVVVDAIAKRLGHPTGASYEVLYGVYKSVAEEWELFPVKKNYVDRAMWIKSLLLDIERIQQYADAELFPMHGEHCYNYFRQCEYFGVCNMSDTYLVGDSEKVEQLKEDDGKYFFKFTLDELVAAQLEKMELELNL